MSLSLRQIEVIRAVMRAGTVTEAAIHLSVSQPAVSRVLKLAEDRLGLALFERRGASTRLPNCAAFIPKSSASMTNSIMS